MKQTAVDFLMGKLFDPSTMVAEQMQWFEQAKEMEKEQIIKAFSDGELFDGYIGEATYYKETFNTK
jgi:hypothetical protein